MTVFNLPDLGEGLPDAEIVEWHVAEGDSVKTDDLLVSVETAKAVVEVPSPFTGVVAKLHGGAGDVIATGAPLVEFSASPDSDIHAPAASARPVSEATTDAATVVGNVPTGNEVLKETAVAGGSRKRKKGRIKATPSVRTQAKKLGIDLAEIVASGKNGQITAQDLAAHASVAKSAAKPAVAKPQLAAARAEPLRGMRRAMAQSMSRTRDEVPLCTIFDDADIDEWLNKKDFTARSIRAIVAGCAAEPALNGFYEPQGMVHQTEARVDVAMAVDSGDGLIVPVIRNAEDMNTGQIREAVARIKKAALERTVAPQDMVNYTFTLSNFGMLAGRYATPLMVPPTVAILGTGKLQHDVVAVMGGIEVHRRIPLSLTFDHRCVTGGEACRFLAAVIEDLEKPQ
ncbi:MAG: 2-oxoisovalerate dehydrogenase E2 component (dihydrolipoyl transacylase) [Woeseiaceae bacterium]|jgi:2-oxoisovalerate dehydrogenase E2 component (dihydrolipoyl transacylase)